jgi:hypothetical protein
MTTDFAALLDDLLKLERDHEASTTRERAHTGPRLSDARAAVERYVANLQRALDQRKDACAEALTLKAELARLTAERDNLQAHFNIAAGRADRAEAELARLTAEKYALARMVESQANDIDRLTAAAERWLEEGNEARRELERLKEATPAAAEPPGWRKTIEVCIQMCEGADGAARTVQDVAVRTIAADLRRLLAAAPVAPTAPRTYPHRVHCNASRSEPAGISGMCICLRGSPRTYDEGLEAAAKVAEACWSEAHEAYERNGLGHQMDRMEMANKIAKGIRQLAGRVS